jgi:hypothetical protein
MREDALILNIGRAQAAFTGGLSEKMQLSVQPASAEADNRCVTRNAGQRVNDVTEDA